MPGRYLRAFRFDRFVGLALAAAAALIVLLVVLYATGIVPNEGRGAWVYVMAAAYPALYMLVGTLLVLSLIHI